jgi:hypothetical protein
MSEHVVNKQQLCISHSHHSQFNGSGSTYPVSCAPYPRCGCKSALLSDVVETTRSPVHYKEADLREQGDVDRLCWICNVSCTA